MEGAILDGASIKNCSFEDPKLRPSSLLGAHMRGVNLEVGSTHSCKPNVDTGYRNGTIFLVVHRIYVFNLR